MRVALILIALLCLWSDCQAGPFSWFSKSKKQDSNTATASLIQAALNDKDEKNRIAAIEGMKGLDAKQNVDIHPTLLTILSKDPSEKVRVAAADALSKVRPISAEVGKGLETASSQDPSDKVRSAAKSALVTYNVSGYVTARSGEVRGLQSEEPPIHESWAGKTQIGVQIKRIQQPSVSPDQPKLVPVPAPSTAPKMDSSSGRKGLINWPTWLTGREKEGKANPVGNGPATPPPAVYQIPQAPLAMPAQPPVVNSKEVPSPAKKPAPEASNSGQTAPPIKEPAPVKGPSLGTPDF